MPRTTTSGEPAAPEASLGLPAASSLVIGTIIGTGIFALPSALAPYGPVSLVAFVIVTLGAPALALTFGSLSKRVRCRQLQWPVGAGRHLGRGRHRAVQLPRPGGQHRPRRHRAGRPGP